MKKCFNCHNQVEADFNVCPYCGANLNKEHQSLVQQNNNAKGNLGWAILGFLIPIVGLILFIVWNDNKKTDAKMAGIGALFGTIGAIVITIIIAIATHSINDSVKNDAIRACCTDSGGVWKNSKCTKAPGSMDFDYDFYNDCVSYID